MREREDAAVGLFFVTPGRPTTLLRRDNYGTRQVCTYFYFEELQDSHRRRRVGRLSRDMMGRG
jgi:hypothetical protein